MKNSNVVQSTDILNRLKVTKGHVQAVIHMIEEDKSCEEILLQLEAVRASVLKISVFVAQHYAETCILDAVDRDVNRREVLNKSIETLMKINQYCIIPPNFTFSEKANPSSEPAAKTGMDSYASAAELQPASAS